MKRQIGRMSAEFANGTDYFILLNSIIEHLL